MGISDEPQSRGRRGRLDNRAVYVGVVLLLLIVGGGICTALILTKPQPSGELDKTAARNVRVFAAKKTSHRVAVNAYGTTRASEVWTAIAEVTGRAVEVHTRFEPGEILAADTLLVRIDPTDYKLALKRFEAEANAKSLQLAELDQQTKNLEDIVGLQKRQLALAQAERERLQMAFERNAVSRSSLDVGRAGVPRQGPSQKLQETLNSLALLPVPARRWLRRIWT